MSDDTEDESSNDDTSSNLLAFAQALWPEAYSFDLGRRGSRLELRIRDVKNTLIAVLPAGPTRMMALRRALHSMRAIVEAERV
jgi:hypothetical protein